MRRTIKEKKPKPLFISTPRGDKSHFDDFWKIKRSELEALKKNYEIAKMYREAMRSTPSVEKLLRQRRKQNETSTKRN